MTMKKLLRIFLILAGVLFPVFLGFAIEVGRKFREANGPKIDVKLYEPIVKQEMAYAPHLYSFLPATIDPAARLPGVSVPYRSGGCE